MRHIVYPIHRGLVSLLVSVLLSAWTLTSHAQAQKPSVLIVYADLPQNIADVKSKLTGTNQLTSVELFDAGAGTPTLTQLQAYDAVLVYSNNDFNNPDALGDVLVDYINTGKGVVRAVFALQYNEKIGGAFDAPQYKALLEGIGKSRPRVTLGTVAAPLHPIMQGVSTFDGGPGSYRDVTSLVDGATLIASWSDGLPLIAVKNSVGPNQARRADLNFVPPSADAGGGTFGPSWIASTDGAKIMANALIWVSGKCSPFKASLTNDGPLTCNNSVKLTAGGGSDGATYQFSTGASQPSGPGSATALATTAGPYSVTVTTSSGCSATAITTVMSNTVAPTVTIRASSTAVCAGQSVTLTASGADTYKWNTAQTSPSISVSMTGTYSVTGTSTSNGCSATATANVTITPLPMAPMIATQSSHSYPGGVSSLTISQNVGNVILTASGCMDGTITWAGGSSNTLAVSTTNTGVQTFTATCTSNATGCSSPPATATVTVVPTTLSVLHRDGNGNINTNTLAPYLQLQNDGNTAIPYQEITVRYWLTVENYAPLLFSINYAQLGSDKVHLKYVPASTGNPKATGYIEFSFDGSAGALGAMSNSGPIQDLINKQDYSAFDQSNDYSYAPVGQFTPNNRITAYRNGVLFYGLEPGPVVPMQSVKAMLQNNTGDGANSIEAVLSVTNDGNIPINYGDLKVRYYFTADNNQPLVLNQTGYTALGSGNVSAQIVTISPALAGADRYLELSFSPSLGQLAPGASTGGVTYQIRHADYSGFSQTNDYSYQGTGGTMVNPHVVVFVAGKRAYGAEPGAAARLAAEEAGNLAVQVLGNPVAGASVSVSVRGAEGQPLRYELTDVSGHVVGERQVESAGAVDEQSISVGHQPAGLLLLRVSTPTRSQTVKVLRQ